MNAILIIMVLIAAAIGGVLLLYNDDVASNKEKITNFADVEEFVRADINRAVSATAYGTGLSLADVKKQNNQMENMRQHIQMSSSGDRGARNAVQQMVRLRLYAILKEDSIESIIPFDPDKTTPLIMFETLVYANDSGIEKGTAIPEDDGFAKLIDRYEIDTTFTMQQLKEAYSNEYMGLEYEDKITILSQIIFSDLYGLGILDTLNYQAVGVEEIQAGMNGPQSRAYDFRREIAASKSSDRLNCAKDSIELVFKGNKIRLPFLGFRSDAEMQRVIRNLIIHSGAGELTEATPKIVANTIDGRRITASRPPRSDAWIVLIRKFDTLKEIDIKKNYSDPLLVNTICQLTKSGSHIAINGEMETGKTTMLRSIINETNAQESIRVIENEAFELNCRLYFPERNIASLRITQDADGSEESILSFVRKTTGHVFAIGEVNSLSMANLCNKLSKISRQILFTAHYTSTESMVSDFTNSKLCNGFTNERLAEIEVVTGLNFDIHIVNKRGHRYVAYINEIVLTSDSFRVYPILEYNANNKEYVKKSKPSQSVYEKAANVMTPEQYVAFTEFFKDFNERKKESEKERLLREVPAWVTTEGEYEE